LKQKKTIITIFIIAERMLVSIVITVKNEAETMPQLLDSLLTQEKPFEIIVVDAKSSDGTAEIVSRYASKHQEIKFVSYDNTRGESRNYGVKLAQGDAIAFTDGSCIADPKWLHELRKRLQENYDIVAGNTVRSGFSGFSRAGRVELFLNGGDASFPTCNIAYKKEVFDRVGGFDSWFKEAEDVDINYRALDSGAKMIYEPQAVIHHTGGETFSSFMKKSFWYGFGRKELDIRHGSLWSKYNMMDIVRIRKGESWWKLVRLTIAFLGYVTCLLIGGKPEAKEKLRKQKISQH
jgi:glycosyltransferase involved in cell wall biosynthesis